MQTRNRTWAILLLFLVAVSAGYAQKPVVEELLHQFETQQNAGSANAFLQEMQRLAFFDDPIRFTAKDGIDTLRQQVWYWAAEWFYDQAQYQQAADYAKRALPLLHIPDEQADCQSLMAIIYVRLSDYRQAADYAKRVYELDQQSGDRDRQSSSLNTLAGIYLYANQPEEAEKYILRGIELAGRTGNTARLAVLEGKASEIYHAMGNDQTALRYAEAAYRLDKEAGRDDKATLRQAQRASVLIGLQRYREAADILTEIIPRFRTQGDRQSLGIACNKMGQALYGQARLQEALPYYHEAARIFSQTGDMANELQAHRGLYEALWKSDPDEAKRELDRFNALRDSLYNNVSAESLAKYNAEFGNDWLKLENHEQRSRLRLAIVLAMLLALAAFAIWWVMRRRHRKQAKINERLSTDIDELRKKFQNLSVQYDNAMITKSDDEDREELKRVDQDFLERTVTTVNSLIGEGQIDANRVARSLGMSLFQFRQRLTAITGLTPQVYIQVLRMRRARYLLDHHHELNIAEVAQLCAYDDAPSFTRSFKNAFGITPSQYLKRQSQAAEEEVSFNELHDEAGSDGSGSEN